MSDPNLEPGAWSVEPAAKPRCLFIAREPTGRFSVGWVSASGCRYYVTRRAGSYEAAYLGAGLLRVTVHGGFEVPLKEGTHGERCGALAMIEREAWEGG